MHYCEDENLVLLNTVDNALRETVYKTAPDVLFYDRPRSWVGDNILNSRKHFDSKIVTKAAFFVVIDRFTELRFSLRMK